MSGYRSYKGAMYSRARAISGHGRRGRHGTTRRSVGGSKQMGCAFTALVALMGLTVVVLLLLMGSR